MHYSKSPRKSQGALAHKTQKPPVDSNDFLPRPGQGTPIPPSAAYFNSWNSHKITPYTTLAEMP